ncbi:MAG: hypothetical protein WCS31_02585 [Verrucomicrobiae bacterium]
MKRFICHTLGIDRAISAATATELIRFVTGPITMLLIIRYLSPETQGYYYSFGAVMGIQVFLEAGFAVSIAQFAAREFANLRFTEKNILRGKAENLSRMRSIYQKARKYYVATASVLTFGLGVGGYFFFSSQPDHGVPWQIPWIVASLCAGLNFLLTPFWAILEGCNRVADVAAYRFGVTIAGFLTGALGMVATQSIWVVIWSSIATTATAYIYIFWKWSGLLYQIRRPYRSGYQVNWRKEIWGFQWRIAGTWGGRYFLEAGIPAIAFQFFGAVPAGKIGMSFQLTRIVASIASSWTATKIPYWGALISRNERSALAESWLKSSRLHLAIAFVGQASLLAIVATAAILTPVKAERILPPTIFAGFSIGWFFYSFWLAAMHYTRAHRLEPFVYAHMIIAVSFLGLTMLNMNTLGVAALSYSFALVHVPVAFWSWRVMHGIQIANETSVAT